MTKNELKKSKQKNEKNGLARKEKILLEEYKAAQDSAQHHDNLVWTATSILWTANVILFGTVLTAINTISDSINKDNLKGLPIALSLLGLVLCLSVRKFAKQFNEIMCEKYNRCKDIEKKLKVMRQHTSLPYAPGEQKKIYKSIMSIFIALWVGIILYLISDLLVSIIFKLHLYLWE